MSQTTTERPDKNVKRIMFKGKVRASDLIRHLERGDGHLLLNSKTNKYVEGECVSGYLLEDVFRNPKKYVMVVRDEASHKELLVHQFDDINGVADYITTSESWKSLTLGSQADYYSKCEFRSTDVVPLHQQQN